jgi:hypothetical protein
VLYLSRNLGVRKVGTQKARRLRRPRSNAFKIEPASVRLFTRTRRSVRTRPNTPWITPYFSLNIIVIRYKGRIPRRFGAGRKYTKRPITTKRQEKRQYETPIIGGRRIDLQVSRWPSPRERQSKLSIPLTSIVPELFQSTYRVDMSAAPLGRTS